MELEKWPCRLDSFPYKQVVVHVHFLRYPFRLELLTPSFTDPKSETGARKRMAREGTYRELAVAYPCG